MLDLTKAQKAVFKILQKAPKRGLTPKEIIGVVECAPRTVRYALKKLLRLGVLKRTPDIQNDMRTNFYSILR